MTEHLFRTARKAGVQGTYLFQTSPSEHRILPPRPAVYVAEAKTREEAREIHRRLWNLGNAPFLVILLPNEIRVHTGFDFSLEDEKKGLVQIVDLTFDSIRDRLVDFRPDSIDSGRLWETQAKHITPDKRVDTHLLNNLRKLEEYLEGRGLELPIIHALIGKYVYIRYLSDRGILSKEWLTENNISIDAVLSRDATLNGLIRLTQALESCFNGAIFPLPSNIEQVLSDEVIALIASMFKGDDPETGQLHADFTNFRVYDFSYIPVETLSSIYEQFLHSQGTGKKDGAVYTPEPVADYLLCELDESKPLQKGMKILDPSCGSGIFLVLAYRRLIELELANSPNNKLKPTELRRILCESLYGVERNKEACYVAEFSLILTLLNYVDPPELHRNKQFKFPSLHNTQIFECDFFDNQSEFWKRGEKFDWIVGNPPWIELKKTTEGENFSRRWIIENSPLMPVGGNRVCEAFSWRVIDLINSRGIIGLLIHANSLFNYESQKYRETFFKNHTVLRITNFSHLAYVLFGGRANEPAATLIYKNAESEIEKPDVIHYAPFIVNQLANRPWSKGKKQSTWTITVNQNEISIIDSEKTETGNILVWKTALWGNWRDEKAIKRLEKLLPKTLGELAKCRNWHFHKGLEIRSQSSGGELEPAPYLEGWSEVDIHAKINTDGVQRSKFRFSISEKALSMIPRDSLFIRKGRSLPIVLATAPHIVINASYCAYSDVDFVIPDPQIGISADKADADYLRAISVLLNSSIVQYYLFFRSPSWGVGRSRIYAKELKLVPVPDFSQYHISKLARFQERLAYLEEFTDTPDNELQRVLDETVEELLAVPKNIGVIAREFISVRLQLNQGKSLVPATESPNNDQLESYGLCLRNELDDFTEGSGLRHKIVLRYSKQQIVCSIEFVPSDQPVELSVEKAQRQDNELLAHIQKQAQQRFSQWVYVQRSLRIFENSKVHICKSPRLIDWTRTQALNDADDIIAEILSAKRGIDEVTL